MPIMHDTYRAVSLIILVPAPRIRSTWRRLTRVSWWRWLLGFWRWWWWNSSTSWEWVPGVANFAVANWIMVHHSTLSAKPTRAGTRIYALFMLAGAVQGTVRVVHTFWSTVWWWADVSWETLYEFLKNEHEMFFKKLTKIIFIRNHYSSN